MAETVRLIDAGPHISLGKKRIKPVLLLVVLLMCVCFYRITIQADVKQAARYAIPETTELLTALPPIDTVPDGYLVYSTGCKIPYIDPHEKDAMSIFKQKKYQSCSNSRLTYVSKDSNGKGILNINKSELNKTVVGKGDKITCCYSNVTRHNESTLADSKIMKSKCIDFNSSIILGDSEEFIVTKCEVHSKKGSKKLYEDAHFNVQMNENVKQRFNQTNIDSSSKQWSVLIIGIDTLSRLNFARAMPSTYHFLKNNSWYDFQGYNKMDDNTYPNLMAFLTGKNQTRARATCDGKGNHSQDNCDFMWKRYQKAGYATAYAEDYVGIDTFGKPYHLGFKDQPTDHYLKPLFIAAEKNVKKNGNKLHCTGQTNSGEMVYDYALSFTQTYKKKPFFGFFWTNTFSHDDLSTPSTMDDKVANYFETIKASGIMENTIIIFLSDHGIRYGKLRTYLTGYFEERLPAFFVWLPKTFKEHHPESSNNMLLNTKRLTSPYDLYNTLQDILKMSAPQINLTLSEGCPKCQSLFKLVPWNRTCDDSSLSPHWCTCRQIKTLPNNLNIGKRALKYVIDVEIERVLSSVNTNSCRVCSKLKLDNLMHLYQYESNVYNNDFKDYLIVFTTKPGDMIFECTIRHYNESDQFELHGIVSRLSVYKGNAGCVNTAHLKKYCHCTNNCHHKS